MRIYTTAGLSQLKKLSPIVNPFPISSFSKRSIRRIKHHLILQKLGLSGAKSIGVAKNGFSLLKLQKSSPLGQRNGIIQIQKDETMYEYVKEFNAWSIEECIFLGKIINKLTYEMNVETVLLDIGANVGLSTIQILNISQTNSPVILVEPLSQACDAIAQNLANLKSKNKNTICNFALGSKDETNLIYTEISNAGNTSLIKALVPKINFTKQKVSVKSTQWFCKEYLSEPSSLVIKCDTQGYDAEILGNVPKQYWNKVQALVVEIWASNFVNLSDVDLCISLWSDFNFVSWRGTFEKISWSEVKKFWVSGSGLSKNLYLSKVKI